MNFNDTLGSTREDLFGSSVTSDQMGNSNGKSLRDQKWEEKRKQRGGGMGGAGPPSGIRSRFNNNNPMNDSLSSISSPNTKKKKKVMFALPPEELQREKQKFEEPPQSTVKQVLQNGLRSEFFNEDNIERENYMQRSQSQPQFMPNNNNQVQNFDQNSINNESQLSDSQTSIPKYSPVKRTNPNRKYIPTQQFVVGEGTQFDKKDMHFLVEKSMKEKQYQNELFQQMEERRMQKEEERRKLKEEELREEERVKRELQELQIKEQMEKENKKKQLGDIMERYQQQEREKKIMKMLDTGNPDQQRSQDIMIRQSQQQEQSRPIQVEMPPGAQYAQYRSKDEDDPNHYDYSQDINKFDVLNRGHRAAYSGVPRAKLIADIGHDLKNSIANEVNRVRESIKLQHMDFKDQLGKLTNEAKIAIEERDRVKNHLYQLRAELQMKRDAQLMQENDLVKTLNKYQMDPIRYHYPQRHVHIDHTAPKQEEKKTIYERLFFDKISNKVDSEKLNPPLNLYREATQNPNAQITLGQNHYYANSKGQLNTESTLVTLDNKQLYPQKSIYEMPDLQSKTAIVNWNREPYEVQNSKIKDINPRDELYFVKNNYENKYAQRINDDLNYKRFTIPEREEHKPQYNSRIKPIDLANINIEKIHQVNELRLSKLDRDTYSTTNLRKRNDLDIISDILTLKL